MASSIANGTRIRQTYEVNKKATDEKTNEEYDEEYEDVEQEDNADATQIKTQSR